MRWLALLVLLAACAPAAAAPVPVATPTPTDDPRIALLATTQLERDDLKVQMAILAARLDAATTHPTFVMWNTNQTIRPGRHLSMGLPDTFTVRIRFTASTPVRALVMTFSQYVRWLNGVSFDAQTFPVSTSLDVVFHDAEGCAGYLLVLEADREAVVTPYIEITRAPNPVPTGACAD